MSLVKLSFEQLFRICWPIPDRTRYLHQRDQRSCAGLALSLRPGAVKRDSHIFKRMVPVGSSWCIKQNILTTNYTKLVNEPEQQLLFFLILFKILNRYKLHTEYRRQTDQLTKYLGGMEKTKA